jgi:DNA primase
MDAISCHQGGFQNVVASSGTALKHRTSFFIEKI